VDADLAKKGGPMRRAASFKGGNYRSLAKETLLLLRYL
jgi:hypothetical protein